MTTPASAGGSAAPTRDSGEFAEEVRGMFDRIAGVYDLMNSAMTVGLHHEWRKRAADRAQLRAGASVLDVACGTGDLSFEVSHRCGPDGRVVGCDFSEAMLEIARAKAPKQVMPADAPVEFAWADALALPYGNAEFDAVTIGFGFRNFEDLESGLGEMTRVLRPGGRLVILELAHPDRPPLSTFYSLWFDRIVPRLGSVAGNSSAYTYLPDSVKKFPPPEPLAGMISAAGYDDVRWLRLAGGVVTIHSGTKA